MNDTLDTDTTAFFRWTEYLGWFHPVSGYTGLYEVHYHSNDPDKAVVVVANCTLSIGETLGNILDTLAVKHPTLLVGVRKKPSQVNYRPIGDRLWCLMLTPMADPQYVQRYADRSVVQLVWSDDHHRFPWNEKWEYHPEVQHLLPGGTRVLH